ncbi:hypothetical protein HZS_7215 [Henneguya salminicola]|nr:hypothetical protein HZS_7215 [Henneguya salminicola]
MAKSTDILWDQFTYLSLEQKKSIVELTNCYEKAIKGNSKHDEENLKDPILCDEKYFKEIRKYKLMFQREMDIMQCLKIYQLNKSNLETAQNNLIKMMEEIERITENYSYISKDIAQIHTIRDSSLLKIVRTLESKNEITFLNNFIEKLDEIENIKNLRISSTCLKSNNKTLDIIDTFWQFIKNYQKFQDFNYYSQILDNKRNDILKSINHNMEKLIINATNTTVETLKNQSEIQYRLITVEFKNIANVFNNDILGLEYSCESIQYLWWEIYSNSLQQLIGDIQAKIVFLAQKHLDRIFKEKNYIINESSNSKCADVNQTLELLNKLFYSLPVIFLFECKKKPVFEKIAQDSISSIIKRLDDSFNSLLINNKINLNGYMFVIKHLLWLREQMTTYDVNFVTKDVVLEFGDFKKAAFELFKNKSNILSLNSNNALLEIELKIRHYCFDLIKYAIESMTGILRSTISLFGTKQNENDENKLDPVNIKINIQEIYSNIRFESDKIHKVMNNYLNNSETVDILFNPIKTNVIELYKTLFNKIENIYSNDDKLLISLPPVEQISLLLS